MTERTQSSKRLYTSISSLSGEPKYSSFLALNTWWICGGAVADWSKELLSWEKINENPKIPGLPPAWATLKKYLIYTHQRFLSQRVSITLVDLLPEQICRLTKGRGKIGLLSIKYFVRSVSPRSKLGWGGEGQKRHSQADTIFYAVLDPA